MRTLFLWLILIISTCYLVAGEAETDEELRVRLDNIYDADAFVDAHRVANSEQPYLLRSAMNRLRLPPFETIQDAKCWTDRYEVRILEGFDDARTGAYSQVREQNLLGLYLNFFNRKVLQEMRRLGRLDCTN